MVVVVEVTGVVSGVVATEDVVVDGGSVVGGGAVVGDVVGAPVNGGPAAVGGGAGVTALASRMGTATAAPTSAATSGAHRRIFSRGGAGSNAQPRRQTSSKVVIVKTIEVITV